VKLISLAGSFLFLTFKLLDCWLNLGQVIVYDSNLQVDLVEFLEKEVPLGFQFAFGFFQTGLRLV